MSDVGAQLSDAMQAITRAWLEGRVDDLAPHVHPDIVMVLPGFAGRDGAWIAVRTMLDVAEQVV